MDALVSKRWPSRCEPELRQHVLDCPVCADLLEVSAAFLDDRDEAWRDARVPPSSIVWLRAQLRARQEASRTALRPIAVAQAVGAIVAFTAIVAVAAWYAPWWRAWFHWAGGMLASGITPPSTPAVEGTGQNWTILVLVGTAWLVLMPLALYLATKED